MCSCWYCICLFCLCYFFLGFVVFVAIDVVISVAVDVAVAVDVDVDVDVAGDVSDIDDTKMDIESKIERVAVISDQNDEVIVVIAELVNVTIVVVIANIVQSCGSLCDLVSRCHGIRRLLWNVGSADQTESKQINIREYDASCMTQKSYV